MPWGFLVTELDQIDASRQADITSANTTPAEFRSDPGRLNFSFHGSGAEYFRIWIVNLVLSIVTLGVYSAWAKVRTNRYFYANTQLCGSRFDYLADPRAILKGRLIAVTVLAIYTVIQYLFPIWGLVAFAVLFLMLPFLLIRALRFRASVTMWRGIRLGFDGELAGALGAFVLWPLFGLVTFGFGMPYAWYQQNQFLINHHRMGTTNALSTTTAGDFYGIFGSMILFSIVFTMLAAGLMVFLASLPGSAFAELLGVVPTLVIYLGLFIVYRAKHFFVVYNNINLSGNRFTNTVSVAGWASIVVTNTLAMIFTLGLFYPWASVRMSRYKLDNLAVQAVDVEGFSADKSQHMAAYGDEIGEAFDLGLGI